ncbi:MAG: hypothetical protein PWR02_187 [Synergistales bacterium]|nr:hypothetical protein [Synergistales bacterium]
MPLPFEHPEWSAVMGETMHPGGEALSRRLLSFCAFAPKKRVLDAGCGAGATLELLVKEGLEAVGVDHSEERLILAQQKGPTIKGDLAKLPFENESFDGAICECVLSQQENLLTVLAELSRVLKDGGILGITDLYLLTDSCGRTPGEKGSCANGARPREEMVDAFRLQGLESFFFEDHPGELRECAARLVWYGIMTAPKKTCRRLGYGLWLCRKASATK